MKPSPHECGFGEQIHWFRVDGRSVPVKKNMRFQNIRIRVDVAAEFGTAVARRLQQGLVPEILRISQMSQFMFENAYKHMSYT